MFPKQSVLVLYVDGFALVFTSVSVFLQFSVNVPISLFNSHEPPSSPKRHIISVSVSFLCYTSPDAPSPAADTKS